MCDPVIEGFGCRVGGEAQDLTAGNSRQPGGAIDEQEAERFHTGEAVAIGAFACARFGHSQLRVQLKASRQVMGQDAELEPGAVGAVVISGNHVEGKLAFELRESFFLRAAAGSEKPQGARGEDEISRHRRVFEVTVVGGEEIELVILGARMVHALAIDHDPQRQAPRRSAPAASRSSRYQL